MTERRPNPNRKDENIRRANRVIQTRSFVLMLVMGVGMFVLLFSSCSTFRSSAMRSCRARP